MCVRWALMRKGHGYGTWQWDGRGLERGASGKQHGNNGAVLASAWGMGRGRHLPAPSPALSTNYTNSTATAPAAEAKGPRRHFPPGVNFCERRARGVSLS